MLKEFVHSKFVVPGCLWCISGGHMEHFI